MELPCTVREWCHSNTRESCRLLHDHIFTLGQTITDTTVANALLSFLQLLKQPKLADDCYSNTNLYLPSMDISIIYTQCSLKN